MRAIDMAAGNNSTPTGRWTGSALSSLLAQIILLILAVLPMGLVVLLALRIWLLEDVSAYAWKSKFWPVVILQVVSILFFCMHAIFNKKLTPHELSGWLLQFIVYIPFGMISYWREHVFGTAQHNSK